MADQDVPRGDSDLTLRYSDRGNYYAPVVANASDGPTKTPLFRHLDTNGDGTGTIVANGNYSGAAEIFYIQPGAGEIYRLQRMIVSLEDTNGFSAQEYGNLGSALTNGITVRVQNDSGTVYELTDGDPVKTNAKWGAFCYDVDLKTWGAGDEFLLVRWTFSRTGQPMRLVGDNNERLEVVLNDDFSGLVDQTFIVQGYIE